MRSRGALALLATASVALLALVLVGATDKRRLAFTLGVVPSTVAVGLAPGATACQAPIETSAEFDEVRFKVGTYGGPGQPLDVAVASGRRFLGTGHVAGGYADLTEQVARVGRITAPRRISVCFRNRGTRRVALYGNSEAAAVTSTAYLDGKPRPADITLVFERERGRSMLSALPAVFRRASVFRPGWVGPWLFWLLGAAVLAGVPLLLARALADAGEDGSESTPTDAPATQPASVP
jgi:hypothetical protein